MHREEDNLLNSVKTVLAAVLIVLGIAAFTYQGIKYATQERSVESDPAPPSAERGHRFPLPPILGAVSLVAGIALLLMETRDFKRGATP